MNDYLSVHKESINNPEKFWAKQAENIEWFKKPEKILEKNNLGSYDWFAGGKMNTCYLALDYHVKNGRGNQVAIYYDSPSANNKEVITYKKLLDRVSRFADGLKKLGVKKGDTVIIYMPMIPRAVIAMLACARIGAIHSVVFGGFAPHELAVRIDDAKPKLLITASYGMEMKKMIPYKHLVDEGIYRASHKPDKVVVFNRDKIEIEMTEGRDVFWRDLVSKSYKSECEVMDSTDPLYILYTSGTTGKPKGVVRRNGDHAVAMKYSMDYVYRAKPGETYWAASDIGWVVGHSYIVYAPLIHGCSTIIYEGKPIKTPDAGAFWRVIQEYDVKTLFTAPTAFRAIKKEDSEAKLLKDYDISALRTLYLAGERLDPPTLKWLQNILDVPVIDHWWQTETGWAIVSNPMGIKQMKIKSGSAGVPVPGYNVQVLDETGKQVAPNETGNIVVKLPLPPSCLPTIWEDNERYKNSYLNTYEGYYLTGDEGYIDEDGYVFIMGRVDDVINVAGHRLSTGEMEELIGSNKEVAECCVVGIDDELKGQIPVGFIILKNGSTSTPEQIENELISLIRHEIGPIAVFKKAIVVDRLPKTRSGKILRKTIRNLAKEKDTPIPSTIDDPKILDEIKDKLQVHRVGQYA